MEIEGTRAIAAMGDYYVAFMCNKDAVVQAWAQAQNQATVLQLKLISVMAELMGTSLGSALNKSPDGCHNDSSVPLLSNSINKLFFGSRNACKSSVCIAGQTQKLISKRYSSLRQGLMPVPDSRASFFHNRTLSLVEQRHLLRFFKLMQNYGDAEELILKVMENRFVDFLDQQRMPSYIKSKEDVRQVFDEMSYRDLVSWRGLISFFAQNGFSEEALSNLREKQCSAAVWPLLGPAENGVVSFRGASTPCKPHSTIKIECFPVKENKKQA